MQPQTPQHFYDEYVEHFLTPRPRTKSGKPPMWYYRGDADTPYKTEWQTPVFRTTPEIAKILGIKSEPWLHTTIVGCWGWGYTGGLPLAITFVWDTREIVSVEPLNGKRLSALHSLTWKNKQILANDNHEPLKQIVDKCKPFVTKYADYCSKYTTGEVKGFYYLYNDK